MFRSNSSSKRRSSDSIETINWSIKELRGVPLKTVNFDKFELILKKDIHLDEKLEKLDHLLNNIDQNSFKLKQNYQFTNKISETLSWCDDFISN